MQVYTIRSCDQFQLNAKLWGITILYGFYKPISNMVLDLLGPKKKKKKIGIHFDSFEAMQKFCGKEFAWS